VDKAQIVSFSKEARLTSIGDEYEERLWIRFDPWQVHGQGDSGSWCPLKSLQLATCRSPRALSSRHSLETDQAVYVLGHKQLHHPPHATCTYLLPERTDSHGHGQRQTRTLRRNKREMLLLTSWALLSCLEEKQSVRDAAVCLAVDPLLVSGRIGR
jgi:hypothetical protein